MRTLREIFDEVFQDWKNINPYAKEYADALHTLESPNDRYLFERGRDIIPYFLANTNGWRGEVAKRIKAELRQMLN